MTAYFVSVDGDDGDNGSEERPFRTIQHAVSETDLQPGDSVLLSTGVYYEHVVLEDLGTDGGAPITLASREGHRAIIDTAIRDFLDNPAEAWKPVAPVDPSVGVVGGLPRPEITPFAVTEYVSRDALPQGTDRGSFVAGLPSYTRLITHHHLRDLQARNQRFGKLARGVDDPPGPLVKGADASSPFPRRPWVYMGPGLWQDGDGHVHVRLSHTTHEVEGVTNYRGQTDPRKLPLAIWGGDAEGQALTIRGCHGIRVRRLTLRHGAGETVLIAKSNDVRLNRVVVLAGPRGIRIGEDCSDIRITDTSVDGGVPPWFFRSDRKDQYNLANGDTNLLGKRTTNLLFSCEAKTTRDLRVERCEFVNGHDLQLAGEEVTFALNWVRNLNDDGLFIGEVATNMWIRDNVVEQCLMAVNVTKNSKVDRQVFVHRNLIDLRLPTIGRRPHPTDEVEVFRYGNMLKDGKTTPALTFTHNTVLVVNQEIQSSYNHFRNHEGPSTRRAYNNIFVAINRSPRSDKTLAFVPKDGDPCDTDGNCYHRMGRHTQPLLKVRGTTLAFDDVDDLQDSDYGMETGYEIHGTDANPRLRRYWPPFELPGVEDLRLAKGSPVRHGGVVLTDLVPEIDEPAPNGRPAIGCYPFGSPPLEVGVEGRRRFPGSGLPEPLGPVVG